MFHNEGPHKHPRENTRRLKSISIRWLPSDVKEAQIRERFKPYGKIRRIVFASSYMDAGHGIEAVISYNSWKEAENAVKAEVSHPVDFSLTLSRTDIEQDNLVMGQRQKRRRVKVDYHRESQDRQFTNSHYGANTASRRYAEPPRQHVSCIPLQWLELLCAESCVDGYGIWLF